MRIDAKGIYYRELNDLIYQAVLKGSKEIILDNVNGQRYLGTGLSGDIKIIINGIPGNDLAAFMDGLTIVVNSNGQDGIGNTMNAGRIVVHGNVGDITGHSMRGGCIYIKGNAGYRIGIHMKSYKDLYPVIIVGGSVGDFLGEYMAGGLIVILGLNRNRNEPIVGNYCGTGMHGGTMYIRGDIKDYQLGKEVEKANLNEGDYKLLDRYLKDYCAWFSLDSREIINGDFKKMIPASQRPYGKLYAY